MTLDTLIEQLTVLRTEHGGEIIVTIEEFDDISLVCKLVPVKHVFPETIERRIDFMSGEETPARKVLVIGRPVNG
jgi:hypothetical protein